MNKNDPGSSVNVFENNFSRDKFKEFIANLLKEVDFYENSKIEPQYYEDFVERWERLGVYQSPKKEHIDILIVYLKRHSSVYLARVSQRNFVADYLKSNFKDAALVAFVAPNGEDWRFSLVKIDYKYEKKEFSPAKRWSFLVGKNEKSHTAKSRFLPLLTSDTRPNLKDIEEAFSVEKVTEEFFEKYRDLFIRTKEALDEILEKDAEVKKEFDKKKINTVDFAKKLLGQITFLYFLQKKGWFGVPKGGKWGEGSKNFIRELFNKKYGDYDNFFNDILEPLFYEALRTDRSHYDHYYSRFDCKIPFLNGGLFDPINDYDWINTDIKLPNELFSNKNITKERDIGDGILDVFDRFNFTINEEEPLEKEVALDPELLGKIYEKLNAIRADNFNEYLRSVRSSKRNEEMKFNKEYGVYYTPREIVHFMCQQSLIHYLAEQTNIPKEDIETFVKLSESVIDWERIVLEKMWQFERGEKESSEFESMIPKSIRENAKIIDELLSHIKICDPAVGSGAFLVGMMHEIVKLRQLLGLYLKETRNSYDLKRHCLEENLYGVDIDAGAVEICKLRLWLSLVVDEEDFQNIKPLPNLDYKVVRGDSLLGFPENWGSQIEKEIEDLMGKYFNTTNPSEKQKLKSEIDKKINERFEISEKTFGYKINFDFKLFFPRVFREKGGFDIVIANPPYIQLQKNKGSLADLYKDKGFETFDRMGDIYCLFYEKGLQILRKGGYLCFITSNKWMRAGYGEKLRNFFLKDNQYNPVILIDLGPGIFKSATVDTNILLIQKAPNKGQLKAVTLTRENNQIDIEEQLKTRGVHLTKLTKDAWFIGSSAEQRLKEKIESIGKPLKDWDVKIYRGILTGLNEAFIITTEKRNEILANCRDDDERKRTEAIIKPILRGRDIKRYYYEWAGLWVIGTFPALRLNIDDYPALKKYFLDNFDIRQLEQSGKKYPELGFNARKKTGNKWFETQDQIAYYPEFEKEKVVWAETDQSLNTVIVPPSIYLQKTCFMIITNKPYLVNALLNSNIVQWYIRTVSSNLGNKGMSLTKESINEIPLPPITPSNHPIVQQIEALVDEILTAKKQNPQSDTSHWEQEIDRLVYQLYELTDEEIRIIEKKD